MISFLPEVADARHELALGDIHLIAASGIVDERVCAAALALGVSGLVMGTRCLRDNVYE